MIALLIKASLIIIVLLAFYKLFLEKESFFAANRFYLLGCLLFAAILPFIGLPELVKHQGFVATLMPTTETVTYEKAIPPTVQSSDASAWEASDPTQMVPINANSYPEMVGAPASPDFIIAPSTTDQAIAESDSGKRDFASWLILLYGFGVLILFLQLLVQIAQTLWKVYHHEDKIPDEDSVLVNLNGNIDPCSFFKYIFINPAEYDYETYEQIIAHERIHVRKWHTIDLLLAELAVIVLWFNPFVWILRREVEKNLEYQTDDLMLREHTAIKESYQLNLIKVATYTHPLGVTTNYNQSLIKKRILKMNAKRSNPYSYVKYSFVLPALFGLSLLLNEPTGKAPASTDIAPEKIQQFLSTQDTLILQMEKHPGYGLFNGGFGPLPLESLSEDDDRRKRIPADIIDPQLAEEYIDYKVLQYEYQKQIWHEYLPVFLEKWYPEKIDTANLPTEADNTVKVIVGEKYGEQVYIVDQNNNLDFRDDPVRLLKKMSWTTREEPVRIHYRIYNGREIVRDSSWVSISRLSNQDRVGYSASQHLSAAFSVDDQDFNIQVFNGAPMYRWCFENPVISITKQDKIQKDSLGFRDKFALGEFLKFGKFHYRFADITNDGSSITLIRHEDISTQTGTQIGLLAPDFKAVTRNGDSIALGDYRGRYLLLANLASICYSWNEVYGNYQQLRDRYRTKMDIVGIEYTSQDLQRVFDESQLNPKGDFIFSRHNQTLNSSYRDFHCSKACFLIDPEGRVVDRFEIGEWEQALAKHFK